MEQQQQEPKEEDERIQKFVRKCEECKENPSKYTCPGCSFRSCGLPCVKAHKQRTGCSGNRNQTQFVPLSEFDDNLIRSDYNLLEEVKRVAESAQRTRIKLRAYPHYNLPYYLRSLRSAAASRRTKLLLLPGGMSKREKNQSRYEQRKKFISWTIEWRFNSTDVILLDHGVHEDETLASVIEKHLKAGPWNHQLKQFCNEPLDSLKFFIRKYPKGPRSPYRELDVKAPLRQLLANVVILEYPVIHVFLPSHSFDFEVVKDCHPFTYNPVLKDSATNGPPSPKGVLFREEEIEVEDSSLDPRAVDFMNYANSSDVHRFSKRNKSEQTLNNSSGRTLYTQAAEASISPSKSESGGVGIFEDMEFDFDQGLIDAYSDLMAEINPDDYLNFEGEFEKDAKLEELRDLLDTNGVHSVEEELEEGEIAE
ncbi:hypothetical protein HS088_TW14G00547 [Tripterygium wilfordii]|uniref:Box C/D snoRNA protein 1 n=1 Tax=Tripterygium wilfordii TaxID=458696 RepID=A0A7J7CQL2_TRIWF|nr:box C/D snoRNA protein 1 [Tripterygium wilfordii]KAF5736405.1 hypothetical protein HS088_TW14G00547 [Tripterygium wilfordii]